jgi:hypothetical protein
MVAAPAARRPTRRSLFVGGAALGAAALALVLLRPRGPAPVTLSRVTTARETIALGGRGLAVAEAGSDLSARIDERGAVIEQSAGDVFYRVEKGGPFVVRTPAGEARVRGTCFRVEVETMKRGIVQMGVGAAMATAVLVTVYEGKVILANEKGDATLQAGERARAASGQAPAPVTDKTAAAIPPVPPADTLSREELVKREQAARGEIARLSARVRELESASAGAEPKHELDRVRQFKLAPSKDELQEMAKDCRLQWDSPGIGSKPSVVSAEDAGKMGLSEAERLAMNRVNADLNASVGRELRQLYIEVTGDKAGADTLSPSSLEREIDEKSNERELKQAYYDLSHERAGLQQPPASFEGRPAVERMMRLMSGLGNRYEQELGKAIGPDRAHELRAESGGWGSRHSGSYGCP